MRRERTFRPTGMRRWPLVVMAVMALTLLPAQPVGAADGTGGSTSGGLTHAQRASLLGIAKDTWKSPPPSRPEAGGKNHELGQSMSKGSDLKTQPMRAA